MDEKKRFLEGVLDQITVKTTSKQTHELLIKFTNDYVDDELMYKSGDKTKGYYIVNGVRKKSLVFDTEHKNTKKKNVNEIKVI